MAQVEFGEPPSLGGAAEYPEYRPWLDRALYLRTCCYCVLRHLHLHVDHYEPQQYAPSRIHDPTNLVLGCQGCNGRGGKGDYHPLHTGRTRLPRDTTGYSVVDIRSEDFAALFEVASDGRISARAGASKDRAEWNIALLNLQRAVYDTVRKENLEVLAVAEKTFAALASGSTGQKTALLDELLASQISYLAKTLPFFDAFGIAISPDLRARVEAVRVEELPALG